MDKRILVSGANGFLGVWVVKTYLEVGYSVRAAVRSEEKGRHLFKTCQKYRPSLELCYVGDIAEEGAFDEAIKDVDGIIYVASPLHHNAVEPKDIIDPAVNGTLGMLNNALKNDNRLKRIVFTGSCVSILVTSEESVIVSGGTWNEEGIKECEKKGKDAASIDKTASKTLDEKATWNWHQKHRSGIKWDICVLNPPYIFGPVIHDAGSVGSLTGSRKVLFDALTKGDFNRQFANSTPGHGWIDNFYIDAANSLSPLPLPSRELPKGTPETVFRTISFGTSKEKRIWGIRFRGMGEAARDVLRDYESHGWLL